MTNIAALNPGDAAILRATLSILWRRYRDCRITVYDRQAEAARCHYPWAHFRQALYPVPANGPIARRLTRAGYGHWWQRFQHGRHRLALWLLRWGWESLAAACCRDAWQRLKDYRDADLIISSGGTYLVENYSLAPALYDYRLSLTGGAPLGFFTQSLGPFRQPRNRRRLRAIFRGARFIFVRDTPSRDHLLDMGVPTERIQVLADAAFALAPTTQPRAAAVMLEKERPHLAVSVRELRYFDEAKTRQYYTGLAATLGSAMDRYGARITFLSTCQGIPDYWTDDAQTARRVLAELPAQQRRQVTVLDGFRDPDRLISAYGQFDAVLATRMHAAILALCAGTPVAAIGYEFKQEAMFAQLGMPELCEPLNTFCPARGEALIDRLLGQLPRYHLAVPRATQTMRASAWQALAHLPTLDTESIRHAQPEIPNR